MRKQDIEVREVVCSETGKPITKIPLWMADIKVKFISDEARQRHPSLPSLADIETTRRLSASSDLDGLKDLDAAAAIDEEEELDDEVAEGEEAEADLEP